MNEEFHRCFDCQQLVDADRLLMWINYNLVPGLEKGQYLAINYEYWLCPNCFNRQIAKRRASLFPKGGSEYGTA